VEKGYKARQRIVKESKQMEKKLLGEVEQLEKQIQQDRQTLQGWMEAPLEVEYLTGDDVQEYVDYVEGEMLAMASECTMPEQQVQPVEKPDLSKIPELPCRVEMPLWECITQTWDHLVLVARYHMGWSLLKDQLGLSSWFPGQDPATKRNEMGARITRMEQKKSEIQGRVDGAYGEWIAFLDRCYGIEQWGMKYQICPFRNATQGSTLLGTFESFDGRIMMFNNGM
jgi:hypothetical protein